MDLFFILLVLLVATRSFGEAAERLGQPALVGELVAGITLGAIVAEYPVVFPTLVDLSHNDVFASITDLGMFFLMLFAGVEMRPGKIMQHSGGALAVAIGGCLWPWVWGWGGYSCPRRTCSRRNACFLVRHWPSRRCRPRYAFCWILVNWTHG